MSGTNVDVGDRVTFVDTDGEEHEGVVARDWGDGTINVVHAVGAHFDGAIEQEQYDLATSVTPEDPDNGHYVWYDGWGAGESQ